MTRNVLSAIHAGDVVELIVTQRTIKGWERKHAGKLTFRWVPRVEADADDSWKTRVLVAAA